MKKIVSLLLIFHVLIPSSFAQKDSSPTIAEHYETKKFNVAIFPGSSRDAIEGGERFTPTRNEVDSAEAALIKQLSEINSDHLNQTDSPVIEKNLSKYKRQYFGYINKKGEKILLINCFWKRDAGYENTWLNEHIRVLDGGSFFWNIKYNLYTDTLFDLNVNGDS
jgi:hypothetical protein